MKKTSWVDATSYSYTNKERIPKTWKLVLQTFEIIVTRHLSVAPDQWVMHCREFGVATQPLQAKELEDAKREAVEFFRIRLASALDEIRMVQ